MTANSEKKQATSDDAIEIEKKQSPDSPKKKTEAEVKAEAKAEAKAEFEAEAKAKAEADAKAKVEADKKATVKAVDNDKSKEVIFRSVRAEFTCCCEPSKTASVGGIVRTLPAKNIRFQNYMYTTSVKTEIEFLRKLINSSGTDNTEVFEMPEVDELLQGDISATLDRMSLPELKQVANERGAKYDPSSSEIEVRYAILKKVTGTSKED